METRSVPIRTVVETPRGCGHRKQGGTYMMSGGVGMPCCRLPAVLDICPTCSGGIKFSRSWTWIDGDALLSTSSRLGGDFSCSGCPAKTLPHFGRSGLLWIGEKYYPTPADWTAEAMRLGISRRVQAVPLDFEIGKTWVFVAHIKACLPAALCKHGVAGPHLVALNIDPLGECSGPSDERRRGVFSMFKPDRVEYVVKPSDSDEVLERKLKRGIELVHVVPVDDSGKPVSAPASEEE